MQIKIKRIFFLTTLLLTTPVFAVDNCPSVASLASTPWLAVGEYAPQLYHATSILIPPYWLLRVGNIKADSEDDARAKLNAAMQTLSGNPIPYKKDNHWRCDYDIGYGYIAHAVGLV